MKIQWKYVDFADGFSLWASTLNSSNEWLKCWKVVLMLAQTNNFNFTHPPTTNIIIPWKKTTKIKKKTIEMRIHHSARNASEEKKDNERRKKNMVIKQFSKGENKILNFMGFLFIDPFKIWYYLRRCSKSEHPTTNKLYSLRSLGIMYYITCRTNLRFVTLVNLFLSEFNCKMCNTFRTFSLTK